ncbi:inactive peptidyl-prolyl cis-trans isomerase FKBP6-like [Parasteatoda tepidariorum]|uniref:inactive peptidyl-prolyl cis-trans isomerase FKBP6-like n=1 Tax=Parasteatoda tepidariorum TaxID=114398 RepID=UPI001C729B6F|nr:inactive peptidyl-prolyl cis-trans isomerase FKBP6-like [Parasteatoda tepidariorum]
MEKLFLDKEITIDELCKGVEFQVDNDEVFSESENESYFDSDTFKTFKDEITDLENEYKPKLFSGAYEPFSVYKERMEPVTSDKKILKEVMKRGSGILIPDKSVVMMHYDAYLENQEEPFDSTRLRKRPYKFLFGDNNLLPGLELSIKTMKKDEMSRFLVSPDYAYGTMGCPPRIPPSAEILYEVEVLNFYDSKDAIEFEDIAPEERKKMSFEKVVAVYRCEHNMANDLFRKGLCKQAIARYRKAANMLQDVNVANEEEDEKRNVYLLKLYLNLTQSYITIQTPNKAIIYADLALRIQPKNPKGLYGKGYALLMISDYERAKHYLSLAKEEKPFDKSINEAITKLKQKQKQHYEWEKRYSKYALACSQRSDAANK